LLVQNKWKRLRRLKTKLRNYSFLLIIFFQLKSFKIATRLLNKISHKEFADIICNALRGKYSEEEIYQVASLFGDCKCACKVDENCICLYQVQYLKDWFKVAFPKRMKDPKYRARIDKLIKDTYKIFR